MSSEVHYVRQSRRGSGGGRGTGSRPRRTRSSSRSPSRLILSRAGNSRLTRSSRGGGGGGSGDQHGSFVMHDGERGAPPAHHSNGLPRTFLRLDFLGATKMSTSEPGVLEVNSMVNEIRKRAEFYKMRGVAIPTYTMHISDKKVSFMEVQSRDVQHIPINMINFVAADPIYPTIVSLVARGNGNRFMCHVFECRSPTQCNAITKTVSLAFRVSYESWLRVEENQRRQEERLEQDMGGMDYFQEWDDHAPRGMPLYNISGYYNSGRPRPRQFIKPRDEMPKPREDTSLPDRLIVTRNQPAARQEFEPEPYTLRFNFDDDDYEAQDEVYVRQDLYNGRRQSMQRQGQNWD